VPGVLNKFGRIPLLLKILLLPLFYYFGKTVHFWQNFLPPGNSNILLKGQGGGCGGGAKSTEGVSTIYPLCIKEPKRTSNDNNYKILSTPIEANKKRLQLF
jgi:hypothetical protein